MDLHSALAWAGTRTAGTLITLRADGRAQSSDISYAYADGCFRISVTADRAKTKNLLRDPRALLHVSDRAHWAYASFDGIAELSSPSASQGDDVGRELLDVYNAIATAPHGDPDEYFQAMVRDRRLVVRFRPTRATGQVPG
jgi:PPOX class probable F420-dependent enzyme